MNIEAKLLSTSQLPDTRGCIADLQSASYWIAGSRDFNPKNIQGGDIVCVFSNGGFGRIHGKLLERLGKR